MLKHGLALHQKKVHNNKCPYHCHICSEKYKQKKSLTLHLKRIHPTEGPYECDFCSTRFMQKSGLDQHSDAVHSKKGIFKCGICKKQFHYEANLIYHQKAAHARTAEGMALLPNGSKDNNEGKEKDDENTLLSKDQIKVECVEEEEGFKEICDGKGCLKTVGLEREAIEGSEIMLIVKKEKLDDDDDDYCFVKKEVEGEFVYSPLMWLYYQ